MHNGCIFAKLSKVIYGLPQAGQIEHDGIPPLKQNPEAMDTQQSANQLHIVSILLWGKIFGK